MADSELIDSLDSLWFFFNVLSPISHKIGGAKVHHTVVQTDQSPPAESLTVKCSQCGGVSPEFESLQKVETPTIFNNSEEEEEEENSSSRKEGKKKKRRRRRKVLGEIDMEVGVDYYKNYKEETVETKWGMLPIYGKKMPPLNDGLAMKRHLKSWAYAVACTVR